MLIRRPAYHINEHAVSCTRGTRSILDPIRRTGRPEQNRNEELASVSQNGVVYLVVAVRAPRRARGLVPRFDFAVSRGAVLSAGRSDTSPSPTRGVDRPEPARLAISSDLIYSIS
jgi:hypothetical protein